MEKFVCPNCHSDNIQKCSMIFKNGTSNRQISVDMGGDIKTQDSGIVDSTILAQEVAPPAKKETKWGAMVFLVIVAVLLLYGGLVIGGVIAGVLAAGSFFSSQEAEKFNNEEYPILYNQWLNTYICHHCGHRFVLN